MRRTWSGGPAGCAAGSAVFNVGRVVNKSEGCSGGVV